MNAVSRESYDDVTYYDCGGLGDALQAHPSDCTRYIRCHNDRATDVPCPDNDPADPSQPYLVFDPAVGACVWPDDAPTLCIQDPPEN
ncbi:chitin binding peritrophin-A domain-containing protein [Streptomyces virginiae]|uniref:chitin binding peritrophin-A domain-containing protein n=1 Tax=Streptomyces virginiae TaxID=1961 RepID=UPI003712831B